MARTIITKDYVHRFTTKTPDDQYMIVGNSSAGTVGVYQGDVRDLPQGIYQVSLNSDDQIAKSGMPTGCYKWGILLIFLSPWTGKVWMYFPDNLNENYMYVMSKWNDTNYSSATWKKLLLDKTSGGVIAEILDFSYQTQERMVA